MGVEIGSQIRQYEIDAIASDGPVNRVYRAVDLSARPVLAKRDADDEEVVALKVVPTVDAARYHAAARLSHPHIIRTREIFTEGDRTWIVMDWAVGSLRQALRSRGRLPPAEVATLGRELADALAYAHDDEVLHRDLKPSNVLVMADGRYVLSDFGVFGELRATGEGGTRTTRSGEIAGTPLYMSPEQLLGRRHTVRSDVFGLGLLLYECLHGHVPGDEADSFAALAHQRVAEPITVPPSPLQAVLERCLALDPDDRYGSADELAAALDALDLRDLAAAPPEPTDAAAPEPEVTDPAGPLVREPPTGAIGPPGPPPPTGAAPPPPDAPGWAAPAPLPDDAPAPAGRTWPVPPAAAVGALVAALVLAAVLVVASSQHEATNSEGIGDAGGASGIIAGVVGVAIGIALATAGFVAAGRIRRQAGSDDPEIERRAANILFGAESRADLTTSLLVEVDQVLDSLRSLDQRVLGMTLVAMVGEFDTATASQDRQSALVNIVTIMDKLQDGLSSWHVRHRDAIAAGVAIVECASGVASAAGGLMA